MGQLYIPGEKEIKGPWFIGIEELEELDKILEFIETKIFESADLEIEDKAKVGVEKGVYQDVESGIKRIKGYHFGSDEIIKKIVLISSDEKRLLDTSLMGILRDAKIIDFKPKELNINIEFTYSNKFSLNIIKRYNGEIKYKVKCFDQNCEDEIRYKIESWLENYQPNKPKQFWNQFALSFIIIGAFCAYLSAFFIFNTEQPDFKTIYKNDITKIIESGVNKDNETKSIELLLKFSTDYKPSNTKGVKKVNTLALRIFSISLFILLISLFKPKTTIGIGKHRSLLKFYKIYTTFVLITLPTLFIIAPFFDWIKKVIGI